MFLSEVIMLLETWNDDKADRLCITGIYTFLTKNPGYRRGGGMSLKESRSNLIIVPDFSITTKDYEVLTLA